MEKKPSKIKNRRSRIVISESQEFIMSIINQETSVHSLIAHAEEFKITHETRKIAWLIYLGILNLEDAANWKEVLNKMRSKYDTSIYQAVSVLPESKELLHITTIDAERTYQEIDLFKNSMIRSSLIRIMFTWAVVNCDLGYIQGMNELAGTIMYAVYSSNISFTSPFEADPKVELSTFGEIFNGDYLDHDVYILFDAMMIRGYKQLYFYSPDNFLKYTNMKKELKEKDGFDKLTNQEIETDLQKINAENSSFLKKRIKRVFELYLTIIDKETHKFLVLNDVEPYLFMFRWVLCMFSREFKLDKLLQVWDIIFANEMNEIKLLTNIKINSKEKEITGCDLRGYRLQNFNFIDYLAVAIILEVKSRIKSDLDEMMVLSKLMNFLTEDVNIKLLINVAHNSRDLIIKSLIEEQLRNVK